MIIPIGHESDEVRRLPWVTFGIIALCILIFIPTNKRAQREAAGHSMVLATIVTYYATHDYLELDERILEIIPQAKIDQIKRQLERRGGSIFSALAQEPRRPKKSVEERKAEEQKILDDMVAKFFQFQERAFYWKYGYIPAKPSLIGLIGHMFLHGGWMHLIFNLFFLYLTGPFVEDVWGRPIYAGFYIMAGLISAFTFGIFSASPGIVLIGASGAISGAMGAFIIRFWNTKIRFAYWIWISIGTFDAPAWVMLIIYLGRDLVFALFSGKWLPGGTDVAHWAHVGGFAFGIAAALFMKKKNIEEKYINPKLDADSGFVDDSYAVYEEAIDLRSRGQTAEAFNKLMSVADASTRHPEIGEALWYVAEQDQQEAAAPYFVNTIEGYIKKGELDFALTHYRQLRHRFPDIKMNPRSKILLLNQMVDRDELDDADDLAREMLSEFSSDSPAGVVLQFAKAVMPLSYSVAERAVALCLKHPYVLENPKKDLQAQLAQKPKEERAQKKTAAPEEDVIRIPKSIEEEAIETERIIQTPMGMRPKGPPAVPESRPREIELEYPGQTPSPPKQPAPQHPTQPDQPKQPAPGSQQPRQTIPIPRPQQPVQPPQHSPQQPQQSAPAEGKQVRVTQATPQSIKGGTLYVNVANMGDKGLSMEHVKYITAAKITPAGSPPFLIIDLLLDPPTNPTIRAVRVTSKTFNPKHLFPESKNMVEAFRLFISRIMQMSSAAPHPDISSVLLSKINTFSTVAEYQTEILK